MSHEQCALCEEEDCTPWKYIKGHVCVNCAAGNKFVIVEEEYKLTIMKLSYLLGKAAVILTHIEHKEIQRKQINDFIIEVKKVLYPELVKTEKR